MKPALPRILALLATLLVVIDAAHAQVDLTRDGAARDGDDPSHLSSDITASSPDDIHWDDRFTLDSLPVTAIAAHGDELYVSGDFTAIGGVPASHIAVWNKRTKRWGALGSGLDGPATSLAVQGDDLYVGGYFATAGGKPSEQIAAWHDPSPSASVPGFDVIEASAFTLRSAPNPARTMTTLRFTLPAPATARLSIVNSVGIEITTLVNERLSAGEHAVAWETGEVPGGVYYYRLRCGDRVESGSVVVVH